MNGYRFLTTMAICCLVCYVPVPACKALLSRAARKGVLPLPTSVLPFRNTPSWRHYQSSTRIRSSNENDDIVLAKNVFARLARRGKSWKRLGPMVDLAVALNGCCVAKKTSPEENYLRRGITDVGTDHGLLAMGLAMTGRFERVVGVDISEHALRNGALKLQNEILSYRKDHTPSLAVEFRQSDGLKAVRPGEADTICISGMGVHSMIDILLEKRATASQQLLLDDLECQRLILQPTSSRPHHLVYLHDCLSNIGWSVRDERIEYLSSRWYLSVAFKREKATSDNLPGMCLVCSKDASTRDVFKEWVSHHRTWILQDAEKKNTMLDNNRRWLDAFEPMDDITTAD